MEITEYLLKFTTYQNYRNWVNSNGTLAAKCVCLVSDTSRVYFHGTLDLE